MDQERDSYILEQTYHEKELVLIILLDSALKLRSGTSTEVICSLCKDPLLEEQAQQERSEPLWPKLQAATEGICMYTSILVLCRLV